MPIHPLDQFLGRRGEKAFITFHGTTLVRDQKKTTSGTTFVVHFDNGWAVTKHPVNSTTNVSS